MQILIILISQFFLCFTQFLNQRILTADKQCNYNGYVYKNKCFCQAQWTGQFCDKKNYHSWYNTDSRCDDLVQRLDHLNNISFQQNREDDDEFPRLSGNSIGKTDKDDNNKNEKNSNSWIRMHDVTGIFNIFSQNIKSSDVHQGQLGNCYFLTALASMANRKNGILIKDAFMTKEDNFNRVYVTRWFIDGKPRYVAVDEWIPGSNNSPKFSQVSGDNQFWAIILEKAWAKIFGNYMNTQNGWPSEIWESMTQAPTINTQHKNENQDSLFHLIEELKSKDYLIAALTLLSKSKNLIFGHSYSVLNVYNINLPYGAKQQLIKVYNPWQQEIWKDNPWSDDSDKWNEFLKNQVNFVQKNDGIFYLSPEDYYNNFGQTVWSEVEEDYELFYQDLVIDQTFKEYTTFFNYKGLKKSIYVQIVLTNPRLFQSMNCEKSPFEVESFKIWIPFNKVPFEENHKVIKQAISGLYKISAQVRQIQKFHKYFSISIYAPKNSIQFENDANQQKLIYDIIKCPNDCSQNGRCNTFNGICTCYHNYEGIDCSKKTKEQCPDNCNEQGFCDQLGQCKCYKGYTGENCRKCQDKYPQEYCLKYAKQGYCNSENQQNLEWAQDKCEFTCGALGFEKFGTCNNYGGLCNNIKCSEDKECNPKNGKCECSKGRIGEKCQICKDSDNDCQFYEAQGYCKKNNKMINFMKEKCALTCSKKNYKEFINCIQ